MQIPISKTKWVALCVGTILMAGSAVPTHADSWFTFKSSKGKTKVADEDAGSAVPPPEDSDDDAPAPAPPDREPAPVKKNAGADAGTIHADSIYAPPEECYLEQDCRAHGKFRHKLYKHCYADPYRCSCYRPLNPYYCDPRDLQVYAAQGHNVPITVPLAPMVQAYNYGWGIPSSRISQSGNYARWHPQEAYSLSGKGRLPANYPTVYQPTDTTQLGYYYNYVPEWQPRW